MTATDVVTRPHPAKWSSDQLTYVRAVVSEGSRILDPFAGTGRIHALRPEYETWGVEIEQEWANHTPEWTVVGDSRYLSEYGECEDFDWIVTSPCFGNRMADHHEAKDSSRRMTYRHQLGRPLAPANAGAMAWGDSYRLVHRQVYEQFPACYRASGPKMLLLNMKNHISSGMEVDVIGWHRDALADAGFKLLSETRLASAGMRFGENRDVRLPDEVMQTYRYFG